MLKDNLAFEDLHDTVGFNPFASMEQNEARQINGAFGYRGDARANTPLCVVEG